MDNYILDGFIDEMEKVAISPNYISKALRRVAKPQAVGNKKISELYMRMLKRKDRTKGFFKPFLNIIPRVYKQHIAFEKAYGKKRIAKIVKDLERNLR